jgi:hypothetical protein
MDRSSKLTIEDLVWMLFGKEASGETGGSSG